MVIELVGHKEITYHKTLYLTKLDTRAIIIVQLIKQYSQVNILEKLQNKPKFFSISPKKPLVCPCIE